MQPTPDTERPAHQPADGFAPPAAASLALGVIGNGAYNALIDKLGRVV